jgi:hypothetical protein
VTLPCDEVMEPYACQLRRLDLFIEPTGEFGVGGEIQRLPASLLRRDSGYEQAKAELCCIESHEVAVAFGPPA